MLLHLNRALAQLSPLKAIIFTTALIALLAISSCKSNNPTQVLKNLEPTFSEELERASCLHTLEKLLVENDRNVILIKKPWGDFVDRDYLINYFETKDVNCEKVKSVYDDRRRTVEVEGETFWSTCVFYYTEVKDNSLGVTYERDLGQCARVSYDLSRVFLGDINF